MLDSNLPMVAHSLGSLYFVSWGRYYVHRVSMIDIYIFQKFTFSVGGPDYKLEERVVVTRIVNQTCNKFFSFEFEYFVDPLASIIMSILITTVKIQLLIYSDNYMHHE